MRWCKQLLDVVGQVAALAPVKGADAARARALGALSLRAAEAAQDLDRGVVAWSGL